MNEIQLSCFKAYDIRGRVPDELNVEIAYRIGRAFAEQLTPKRVAVGRDVRLSSEELAQALSEGLRHGGADVWDIGLCGTEEVYFATFHHQLDGGIMLTASHNPMDYNGMKLVRAKAQPISGDTGLKELQSRAERGRFATAAVSGSHIPVESKQAYIEHLLSYVDRAALKPLKIVVNAGNGGAGLIIDQLEPYLPFEFIKIQHEPDGSFPNGIPNPLLPERRAATAVAVRQHRADLGLAWDGDFDRCFFFDEHGRFIEGYYLVGLLASALLQRHPGEKIIHDPRLTWNTIQQVQTAGGVPIQSKTGHAFIKERMRLEDALYGGEMSAHHYFRTFAYCDSGMIPWLLIAEHLGRVGQPLSALVNAAMQSYPCSGEINYQVRDLAKVLDAVQAFYADQQPQLDYTDGLSMEFAQWRMNIRGSNTEPLLRLNIETRADPNLLAKLIEQVEGLIKQNAE